MHRNFIFVWHHVWMVPYSSTIRNIYIWIDKIWLFPELQEFCVVSLLVKDTLQCSNGLTNHWNNQVGRVLFEVHCIFQVKSCRKTLFLQKSYYFIWISGKCFIFFIFDPWDIWGNRIQKLGRWFFPINFGSLKGCPFYLF